MNPMNAYRRKMRMMMAISLSVRSGKVAYITLPFPRLFEAS